MTGTGHIVRVRSRRVHRGRMFTGARAVARVDENGESFKA
jgi:hypothetical protein